MFACKNLDAAHPVIKSISQNGNEVTVTFYPGLDAAAAGLTRTEALKADLHAVFTSSGIQQHLTLTLSVSDFQCCPGLFIPDGEYNNIAMTTTLPYGSDMTNTDGRAADALLTASSGGFNSKTGYGLCYYYRNANSSGTPGNTSSYTWNNAAGSSSATSPFSSGKGVCQHIQGIDAGDAHGDWRLPNLGELAQIGQLASSNTVAINAGIGSQAEINKAINKASPNYSSSGSLPAGTVTANGTYNMTASYYWSSTKRNDFYAWDWDYYPNYRFSGYIAVTGSNYVRCVRRF
jgi:hypothetical protein